MKRIAYALSLAIVPALALISCQPAEEAMQMAMETDVAAFEAAIAEGNAKFVAAVNAGDAAGVAALFTEDAVRLPPTGEVIRGRAAIEAFESENFMQETDRELGVSTIAVDASGDMAYEVGTWTYSATDLDGMAMELEGTFLAVWKMGADGSAKLAADTWSVAESEEMEE